MSETRSKSTSNAQAGLLQKDPPIPGLKTRSQLEKLTQENWVSRDQSWLEFNRRVLFQAQDDRVPILERLNFMGIFFSNLDEFVMKRVGRLKTQIKAKITVRSTIGLTPQQQIAEIKKTVKPMIEQAIVCFDKEIIPELKKNKIFMLDWGDLKDTEIQWLKKYFRMEVFPILTPLSVDPGHPFPFISNLSTSLGITLKYPGQEERFFARVKVPKVLPQWVRIAPDDSKDVYRFISIQDLIHNNLDLLFPGMHVESVAPFRLTRSIEFDRNEEEVEDLLEQVEEKLKERRFADVIRVEYGPNPDPWIIRFVTDELEISEEDLYERPYRILNLTQFEAICSLNFPKLKFIPFTPVTPMNFEEEEVNIFNMIKNQDQLVHHPYDSFSATVERFIRAATEDPRVLAIKMTLYRTSDDSVFIPLLIKAAEAGKQVVCLVELKARFDEERNIFWAQALEKAGVHVVYGIVGLKTHTKIALVARKDADGLRTYVHIGTGNYHSKTARLYTDLGLFTCNPEITEEITHVFHFLTGRSLKEDYQKLLVAPIHMKEQFLAKIHREIENKKKGFPAHIIAKMNSLEDPQMIQALYAASQAGVGVQLIVRGFCCLRPGVPGLSENIDVISVIGRFLEHSRVYYFRNASDQPTLGEFYIGSADWMTRNLHDRVEVVTPIENQSLKDKCFEILTIMLNDQKNAWSMQRDGKYTLKKSSPTHILGTHDTLITMAKKKFEKK